MLEMENEPDRKRQGERQKGHQWRAEKEGRNQEEKLKRK